MVKRLKDIAEASSESNLAATVQDSARQIWLAGLGAFAKAQEEGAKVFDALVQEGKGLEAKTRKMTESRVNDMNAQMNKAAATATKAAQAASDKANAAWDKLEQVFEDRVARALNRLGVPTHKDINSLSKQVAELSSAVTALRAKQATKAPRSRGSSAPVKKAAKRKPAAQQ
jgi:poly(hydroxyalkanoate) granule-associated protein